MPQKEYHFTAEGLAKLEVELDHLKSVRRPEVAAKIQLAKEMGGMENNAEYEDAKNEQSFVEGRILTLEKMIQKAVIIPQDAPSSGRVRLGSKVILLDQDGKEEHYTIVGSAEANPSEGRISNESPVGEALLDRKVGEVVEIEVLAGVLRLVITDIK